MPSPQGPTTWGRDRTVLDPDHAAVEAAHGGVPPEHDVQMIPVARVRPEDGLGRKRNRLGHDELRESIAQFGVLTPITVRPAPDGSGDYLLIKGQGRTLACALLGHSHIPAVVVGPEFDEAEKVGQFLVENVARLKMRPIDRALLIARARGEGEETTSVATRFGISAGTVRRLQAQVEGASSSELSAMREGRLTLALHGAVMRHVEPEDRADVLDVLLRHKVGAAEGQQILIAVGWTDLSELGRAARASRVLLLDWVCRGLAKSPPGSFRDRLSWVAARLPENVEGLALESRESAG